MKFDVWTTSCFSQRMIFAKNSQEPLVTYVGVAVMLLVIGTIRFNYQNFTFTNRGFFFLSNFHLQSTNSQHPD